MNQFSSLLNLKRTVGIKKFKKAQIKGWQDSIIVGQNFQRTSGRDATNMKWTENNSFRLDFEKSKFVYVVDSLFKLKKLTSEIPWYKGTMHLLILL